MRIAVSYSLIHITSAILQEHSPAKRTVDN